MKILNLSLVCVVAPALLVASLLTILPISDAHAQRRQISYSQDIVPIFKGWCISCHQPRGQGYKASGVDLRTYAGLMKGTKYGAVVIPGQPDSSTLIALVFGRTSPKIRMPFGHKPLPSCLRDELWSWIFQGAKDN